MTEQVGAELPAVLVMRHKLLLTIANSSISSILIDLPTRIPLSKHLLLNLRKLLSQSLNIVRIVIRSYLDR